MFIQYATENPNFYFTSIALVAFSICCHEYMHARAALWQGDDTAARLGHLTLNPLKQMGLLPIIMLCIIGITWGQVPVNPSRLRHHYSRVIVSLAGPITNLALFVLFVFAGALNLALSGSEGIYFLFSLGAALNVVLFCFNMLPIPPLDGYSVFQYFFPRLLDFNSEFKRGMVFFLFLLIFFSFHWIWALGFALAEGATLTLGIGFKLILSSLNLVANVVI